MKSDAPGRKLFVGPRLRRLREQRGWNQSQLAARLGLSLSYVSQIETNQRPVTAGVLLKLAEVFGGDVAQFSEDQDKRLLADLDAALSDRTLAPEPPAAAQLARLVEQAPELAEAYVALYQRHQRLRDEHAQLIDRFYGEEGAGQPRAWAAPLPHEEVRDFFNRRNNYLDTLDRRAEALARELALRPAQRAAALREVLLQRCGVAVEALADPGDGGLLRHYDARRRRLQLPPHLSDAQQAFQMATQYALLTAADVLAGEIREAGFADDATCALARQGLAHYFAGAVLLPYADFLAAARESRYDVELLQQRFHVGFETVCHRLSTLQRQGARGVPFYFVRVDQAGNISKRQSAGTFHFARHGGACPLWNVHEAFAQPGRILTQVAEMPDGSRFFGIARTIERQGGGGFRAQRKHFAIGLGCDLAQAHELVYADGLALGGAAQAALIGPGCRVCPREHCVQRAFPPAGKPLVADSDRESLVSYRFSGA
ncbi:MAG: short-chain fatty acyl-CoA regulator family protein [Roseateles sp.]|uniref:short-chain fatty acyl-CoA regulator family protein n=1 Tax=Roseateles sp. TaxID=1971397 RepID=UPI0039EA2738